MRACVCMFGACARIRTRFDDRVCMNRVHATWFLCGDARSVIFLLSHHVVELRQGYGKGWCLEVNSETEHFESGTQEIV
jgi:hypothetical protein